MSDAANKEPAAPVTTEPAAPESTAPVTDTTTTAAPAAPAPVATSAPAPKAPAPTIEPTRDVEARVRSMQEQLDRQHARRDAETARANAAEAALKQRDAELAIMRHSPGLSPETVAVLARGMQGAEDLDAIAGKLAEDLKRPPIVTTRAPGSQVEPLPKDPVARRREILRRGGK